MTHITQHIGKALISHRGIHGFGFTGRSYEQRQTSPVAASILLSGQSSMFVLVFALKQRSANDLPTALSEAMNCLSRRRDVGRRTNRHCFPRGGAQNDLGRFRG
ncbi:hypothetical protein, partial [Asaia sp. SF2.1]|uniref:hypothetical protein n=1 Tax=Asaia sp. SF2.1 TaxID=406101 RepID=UPI001F158C7A